MSFLYYSDWNTMIDMIEGITSGPIEPDTKGNL